MTSPKIQLITRFIPQAKEETLLQPITEIPISIDKSADYFAELDARRISLAHPPLKPVPVFKLCGQSISTAGNIAVISAQAKAGKSAAIGAMLAAIVVGDDDAQLADCLGFEASNHCGKAVILFDTEQSEYDSYNLVRRAANRASVEDMPENFRLYRLIDVPTRKRREYLAAEMERASRECGGVHSMICDGIGDLCLDLNDTKEAFQIVEDVVILAVKHDCPIVVVLHENPTGQNGGVGKTRGHLGSHLERKAESNLRIIKSDEVSVIFSEKSRNANIPQASGAQFEFNLAAGMHVTVAGDAIADKKRDKKREDQRPVCDAVFQGVTGSLKYGELVAKMRDSAGLTNGTAKRRVKDWSDIGLIKPSSDLTGYLRA